MSVFCGAASFGCRLLSLSWLLASTRLGIEEHPAIYPPCIIEYTMMGFAESLVALQKERKVAPSKPRAPSTLPKAVAPRDLSAVYIADEAYAWLPASVIKVDGDDVTVSVSLPKTWLSNTVLSPDSTIDDLEDALSNNDDISDLEEGASIRIVNLKDYPRHELPLQNGKRSLGKRDMADLPFLHEAAILYNLKQRHYDQQPYTRVGDIIIAMNPFTWMNDLYSQETRDLYAKSLVWEAKLDDEEDDEETIGTFGSVYDKLGIDPHVYETSCLAYRGLALSGQSQTILVSGESGAGKTETVKIVMSHLATLEQTRPWAPVSRDNETVIMRVLESSPVFEAFGNAKTIRNDNSSRFGKFTQLQFHRSSKADENQKIPSCSLAGSLCITYLLEKTRVVSHSEGERTYHVFYQLMAASNEFKKSVWDELDGATVEDFHYLVPCSVNEIDGVTDEEQWQRTLEGLKVFQFEGDRLRHLMRALCVVLLLGNLTFDEDPTVEHQEGGTLITSVDELDRLSELIGVPAEILETCMTMRLIKTGYDELNVQLRPSVAKESCDALAKEIYAQIFELLVRSINEYTRADTHYKHEYGLISLLDIFGFERFKVNRFEQLCINYANEQLQHKYVLDNFRQVQEEYEAEGIEIFDFKVVDNSDVLDLMEGRLGLIISLNEECVRPKGNDESYVYKIKIVHKEHSRLVDEKLHRRTEFGVRHFAGPVTYDSTKFVERNTDKLPDGLLYCAAKSTNPLIRQEFERLIAVHEETESAKGRKKKHRTVLEKFRNQLKSLMATMEGTSTRYIRCIKPNETMTPKMTDHYHTMRQLECAGLVTAIAISRESFPNRLGYNAIRERFECLMIKHNLKNIVGMDKKDAVNYMLSNLLPSMADVQHGGTNLTQPFACGKTRVYFRTGALEHLETMRLDYYTTHTVVIQRWIRKIQASSHFLKMKDAAIQMQTFARCRIEMNRYRTQQAAALSLQCWCRGMKATEMVKELRMIRAVTLIQARYRARTSKKGLQRFKRAVSLIQHVIRNRKKKTTMTAKLAIAVEEARMDNRVTTLRDKISACSVSNRAPDENTLLEVESMLDYLRNEIFSLRGANSELRAEVNEMGASKRELEFHAESTDMAASSSRLQVAQLTKANEQLQREVSEYKSEILVLRHEMKTFDACREEESRAIQSDYEEAIKNRDLAVIALQKSMEKSRRQFEREKEVLQHKIVELEEMHKADKLHLKNELKKTQDSHHEYLVKLMDVLDTTQMAREEDTARISEELEAVKQEKDALIIKLQREVQTLRQSRQGDIPTMQSNLRKKESELSLIRQELENSEGEREQRSQKFFEVALSLETLLGQGSRSPSERRRRSITGGKKSPQVLSEEDLMRMKQMVRYLGELYAVEESCQSKLDSDLISKLDEYLVTAGPNEVIGELDRQVKAAERENLALKKQVFELSPCRRCEARDQKRRDRNESSRSLNKSKESNRSQSKHRESRRSREK